MFGTGIVGSTKATPKWIYELVSEVERACDFCLDAVYYKEAKQKNYYRGVYYTKARSIELYFSPEVTDVAKAVVLHELAHAYQHLECTSSLTKKVGLRNKHHNDTFCSIVKRFYDTYKVTEAAKSFEYKRVVKYISHK